MSGEESVRLDGSEPASDAMRSVAQVPRPGDYSRDEGQREVLAMDSTSDPLALGAHLGVGKPIELSLRAGLATAEQASAPS